MGIRKIRQLDADGTVGISFDKDEMRAEGLIENGEFVGPEHAEVVRVDDGEWRVRRLDQISYEET